MKKIATIVLSLSLFSTAAFAQTVAVTPTTGAAVASQPAPTVVVAGGIGGGGIALALIPLALLAALGGSGGSGTGTTGTTSTTASN